MINRAYERVLRWLSKSLASGAESIADHADLEYEDRREELNEIADLCGGRLSRDDVVLVYRADVWDEPLAKLALEAGVSVSTIFSRISRARARLRSQLGSQRPSYQRAA